MIRCFTLQELDKIGVPFDYVQRRVDYQGRWTTIYEYIFEHEGKYYSVMYETGNTEYQDGNGFATNYEGLVECVEVEKKEVMVTKFVPVAE